MDLYLYVIITTLMHIVWGINLSNSNNNYAMQMDSESISETPGMLLHVITCITWTLHVITCKHFT
jgi:hypothetical protein